MSATAILANMVAQRKTCIEIKTKKHPGSKFITSIRIKDICLLESIATTGLESQLEVENKTIDMIKSFAKLVNSFKSSKFVFFWVKLLK